MLPTVTGHEIRRNTDGTLDEIVGWGFFHLEQMDDGHWWLGLDTADGKRVMVNLSTKRGARIHALAEYDGDSDLWQRAAAAAPAAPPPTPSRRRKER